MLLIVHKIRLYKYNIFYSFNLNNASINTFIYNLESFAQNNQTAEIIPTTRFVTNAIKQENINAGIRAPRRTGRP